MAFSISQAVQRHLLALIAFIGLGFFLSLTPSSRAEAPVGAKAPDFSVSTATGESKSLSDFSGKFVVLEWHNKDCPYVVKHYGSNNMQGLQKKYTEQAVVWLTVLSSAPGKQGHLTAEQVLAEAKKGKWASSHILLDPDGKMGRAFGARVTPHMFILNPEGHVVYNGAIDDNSSANPKVIPESKNYVATALDALLKGEEVKVSQTRPYGCSVKY